MPTIRLCLFDLYCGAGGCAVGYQRAGFVGVDIVPQPHYELAQAVPPAFTEYIDTQLRAHLGLLS